MSIQRGVMYRHCGEKRSIPSQPRYTGSYGTVGNQSAVCCFSTTLCSTYLISQQNHCSRFRRIRADVAFFHSIHRKPSVVCTWWTAAARLSNAALLLPCMFVCSLLRQPCVFLFVALSSPHLAPPPRPPRPH